MGASPAGTPVPTAGLLTGVKALHQTQETLLTALQQPSGYAVQCELWHALLCVCRSGLRMLEEVLLDSPLIQDTKADTHTEGEER